MFRVALRSFCFRKSFGVAGERCGLVDFNSVGSSEDKRKRARARCFSRFLIVDEKAIFEERGRFLFLTVTFQVTELREFLEERSREKRSRKKCLAR